MRGAAARESVAVEAEWHVVRYPRPRQPGKAPAASGAAARTSPHVTCPASATSRPSRPPARERAARGRRCPERCADRCRWRSWRRRPACPGAARSLDTECDAAGRCRPDQGREHPERQRGGDHASGDRGLPVLPAPSGTPAWPNDAAPEAAATLRMGRTVPVGHGGTAAPVRSPAPRRPSTTRRSGRQPCRTAARRTSCRSASAPARPRRARRTGGRPPPRPAR